MELQNLFEILKKAGLKKTGIVLITLVFLFEYLEIGFTASGSISIGKNAVPIKQEQQVLCPQE